MLEASQMLKLDKWQQDVMSHQGSITIRAGRQVGKSTVIAMKAANFAAAHPNTVTLVIAASHTQSKLLFEKIRGEIDFMIDAGKTEYFEPPTLTRIILKNGARIYALPAGRTGYFIRGFTVDLLIADEAAYIAEEVWKAVIPMIAVSKKMRKLGWIILLSTPFGKGGYFFNSHHDNDFRQFHISSEKCSRIPKDFLIKERNRMTKAEYAQEYLGEFIDEWNQMFPTALIKKCMTFIEWNFEREYKPPNNYYLGVDIARYGGDENAFVVAELDRNNNMKIVKALTTTRMSLTDTVGRIKLLDDIFHFRKIFTDDGGLGGGVTDMLIEEYGRRIIGINNASRSIDKDKRQRSILKEDLYSNTLILMESAKIQIIADLKLMKSMKSITFEYTSDKRLRLQGNYSHLTEALVRACWSIKERGLKAFIA